MSMVRYTRKELNENFSDKQDAEIKCLLAKGTTPDEKLDLSDIPEISDWSNAVRHIRIISARQAEKKERKQYEQNRYLQNGFE